MHAKFCMDFMPFWVSLVELWAGWLTDLPNGILGMICHTFWIVSGRDVKKVKVSLRTFSAYKMIFHRFQLILGLVG